MRLAGGEDALQLLGEGEGRAQAEADARFRRERGGLSAGQHDIAGACSGGSDGHRFNVSTRAPRSAITKPSTTSSLSRVARKASPGALRSEERPSTRRTGNSKPAFSVALCGSGAVPPGPGGGGVARRHSPQTKVTARRAVPFPAGNS